MSNGTSAYPFPPEAPGSDALFSPPPPFAPPHVNYTLGCRPFAAASLRAACTHVHKNPLCAHGDVDYLSFYYCDGTHDKSAAAASFAAAPHWLKVPMLTVWAVILFAAIGGVADRFFAPAVERIAKRLKLSEDVAGATLLALGGAAPDIFTQAAAIAESATPDVRLAISESVGSGLFVATVGKALAVLGELGGVSPGADAAGVRDASARRKRNTNKNRDARRVVEVDAFPYVRDALAYGGLIVVTAASVADGEVTTPEALALVAWYVAYVWVVLRGEDAWRRARGLRPRADGGGGGGVIGTGRDIEMTRNASATSPPGAPTGASVSSASSHRDPFSKNPRATASTASAPFQGVFDSAADLREFEASAVRGKPTSSDAATSADVAAISSDASDVRTRRSAREGGNRWVVSGELNGRQVGDVEYGDAVLGDADDDDAVDGEERRRLVGAKAVLSGESILAASSARLGFRPRGASRLGPHRRLVPTHGQLASLRRWAVTHGGLGRDRDEDDGASSDDETRDDANDADPFASSDQEPRLDAKNADWLAYASAPILLLMSLTMVTTRAPGRVARAHLATALTLGPAFAATVTGAWSRLETAAGTGACVTVGVLWTAAAWFCVYAYVPLAGVNPRASPFIQAWTFVVGIIWMHQCADELVGVFQAAGRIAGVRESLLGATVMAWGASAGDLGAMLAMARAGYVKMAMTAALAGPLCQLSMGSGLSMVLVRLRGVQIDSQLAPNTAFLLWFGAVFVLSYYGFVVPYFHRCEFGRAGAWTVAGAYAAACAVFVVWGIASGGED